MCEFYECYVRVCLGCLLVQFGSGCSQSLTLCVHQIVLLGSIHLHTHTGNIVYVHTYTLAKHTTVTYYSSTHTHLQGLRYSQGNQVGKQIDKVRSGRGKWEGFGEGGLPGGLQGSKIRDKIVVDEVVVLVCCLVVFLDRDSHLLE